MGRSSLNWFAGVRTPWTLSSERSWRKTNWVGGWLFVLVGVGFIAGALAGELVGSTLVLQIGPILAVAMVLLLVVYSYLERRSGKGL